MERKLEGTGFGSDKELTWLKLKGLAGSDRRANLAQIEEYRAGIDWDDSEKRERDSWEW